MSLYFWEPANDWAEDSFRKRYTATQKLDPAWPSHIRVIEGIHNDDLNCHSVGDAIKRIRRENLNWAIGTATHLPYSELEGVTYKVKRTSEVRPVLGGNNGVVRQIITLRMRNLSAYA